MFFSVGGALVAGACAKSGYLRAPTVGNVNESAHLQSAAKHCYTLEGVAQ